MEKPDNWTTIPVKASVRERLRNLKEDGESYTDLIENALDYVKEQELSETQ